jgi:hypothetical protein
MNREPGCDLDGGDPFAVPCPGQSEAPPSVMVVVDPKTWKVIDWMELQENTGARMDSVQYNGKNYAYFSGSTTLYRYIWDGKNLTLDNSWGPVSPLKPNQTGLLAPVVAGEWVFTMTNCCPPSNVPLSVIAVSQANSSKISRIDPIPLEPGQQSMMLSNTPFDAENNLFYASDGGAGKIAAIRYDPTTGNMSVVWTADQRTQS